MGADLSKKKIIMIHGLASKPPAADVHDLWKKCLIENIRVENKKLANELEQHEELFGSAYWANATPHHITDDTGYVRKLRKQVDKVIEERRTEKQFHVGRPELIGDFFKDRGVDLVKLLAGALTVKDDVMKMFLRETELYDEDQYIADQIKNH